MAKKFYVVWVGRETGVFSSWDYTKVQVDQFPKAKYKSFKTQVEADNAFSAGWGSANSSANNSTNSSATINSSAGNTSGKRENSKTKAKNDFAIKTAIESNNEYDVTIYCDGGCEPNPGKAASGVAVYFGKELKELWYGLYNPQGTNNTAELNALFQSLLIAKQVIDKGQSVQVLCDSKYSIDSVTNWAFNWKKKGWKRKVEGDIKNLAIIQLAHELFVSISEKVNVSHVKAHIGVEGNELADRMSIYGIEQQDSEFCRYTGDYNIDKILTLRTG